MANKYFIGQAADLRQEEKTVIGGTWAEDDWIAAEIAGITLKATLGTAVLSHNSIAQVLANMVNASVMTEDLVDETANGELRNAVGQEYGPWRDVVAYVDDDTVWFRSSVPGRGFDLTITKSSTSGTATDEAPTVVATGKTYADNDDNWLPSGVPIDDDHVILENCSVDLIDALDTLANCLSWTVRDSYNAHLGRSPINTDHEGYHYQEYRPLLAESPSDNNVAQTVSIGTPNSTSSANKRRYLDFGGSGTMALNITVYNSTGSDQFGPLAQIVGGLNTTIDVRGGLLGVGMFENADEMEIDGFQVSGANSHLIIGPNSTFEASPGTFRVYKGLVEMDQGTNDVDIENVGGTVRFNPTCTDSGVLNGYDGATFDIDASAFTATQLNLYGGSTLDASDAGAVTLTKCDVWSGFNIVDPGVVTYTAGIDCHGCSLADHGDNTMLPIEKKYSIGAITA